MSKQYMGYDDTKKMLNKIRSLNESISQKKIMKEQDDDGHSWEDESWQWTKDEMTPEMSENPKNDIVVINDVDVNISSTDDADMELSEEQKNAISGLIDNFRQQVTNLVNFDPGLTISMDQIRLDGVIDDFDFKFTCVAGKDTGLYVICNMTEVTPELIDLLSKFSKFHQSYIDTMNNVISQRKNN